MQHWDYDAECWAMDAFVDPRPRRVYVGSVAHSLHERISTSMLNPNYEDQRWREHPRTIFVLGRRNVEISSNGEERVNGAVYEYDDRIRSYFGHTRCQELWTQVRAETPYDEPECYQRWLRLVYDEPDLKLVHMLAGINHSTLYTYHIFGMEHGTKVKPPPRRRCAGTDAPLTREQVERVEDKHGILKRSARCPECGRKVNVPRPTKAHPSYSVGAHPARDANVTPGVRQTT